MDTDGNISDAVYGEDRTTAEKHTSRESLEGFNQAFSNVSSPATSADVEVDKMTDLFANMAKKRRNPQSQRPQPTKTMRNLQRQQRVASSTPAP